jgi:hypothetical protein
MSRDDLEFVGWGVDPDRQDDYTTTYGSIDVTGYNEGDYWVDGEFLGPDTHGITPIYVDAAGNQWPDYAEKRNYIA